ncbi:MAG: Uma2 family endonuclease [Pyrinomonadaceae bacterium]
MSQTAEKFTTVDAYLVFEEKSKIKHEYMDGEIFAMSGVKRNHSFTTGNIFRHLANQLEGKNCEVHQSDIKVRVRETHFVYPDVIVGCGELNWESNESVWLNPQVVFEVLSKSTEARDRGDKAHDYRRLPSLTDYILVSQKEMLVEHYIRQDDGSWKLIEYTQANNKIVLTSINCELSLSDIYFRVQFPKLKLVKPKKKNGK